MTTCPHTRCWLCTPTLSICDARVLPLLLRAPLLRAPPPFKKNRGTCLCARALVHTKGTPACDRFFFSAHTQRTRKKNLTLPNQPQRSSMLKKGWDREWGRGPQPPQRNAAPLRPHTPHPPPSPIAQTTLLWSLCQSHAQHMRPPRTAHKRRIDVDVDVFLEEEEDE